MPKSANPDKQLTLNLDMTTNRSCTESQMLARNPTLVTCGGGPRMASRVAFLEELGLSRAQVAKAAYRYPHVYSASIENRLRVNADFLRSELALSDAELAGLVASFPNVLGLKVAGNLAEKLGALRAALGADDTEEALRTLVLRSPALLGYSLSGRIAPRLATLRELGLAPGAISTVVSKSDLAFLKWEQRRRGVKIGGAVIHAGGLGGDAAGDGAG